MNTDDFKNEEEFDLYVKGAWDERKRIITLSENKVCFDNRDKGECEHSVCYGMLDLIALIKNENAT
jgi:hypothetical protein